MQAHILLAKQGPKLVRLLCRIRFRDGLKSLFFSRSFVCCRAGVWAGSAGACVAVGRGCFRRPSRTRIKNAIYECGLESKGDAWVQFRSAYYLYAIMFLIFDVEAVFCCRLRWRFTGSGRGGLCFDAGVCAAADRRVGVGVGEGCVDVGLSRRWISITSVSVSDSGQLSVSQVSESRPGALKFQTDNLDC